MKLLFRKVLVWFVCCATSVQYFKFDKSVLQILKNVNFLDLHKSIFPIEGKMQLKKIISRNVECQNPFECIILTGSHLFFSSQKMWKNIFNTCLFHTTTHCNDSRNIPRIFFRPFHRIFRFCFSGLWISYSIHFISLNWFF